MDRLSLQLGLSIYAHGSAIRIRVSAAYLAAAFFSRPSSWLPPPKGVGIHDLKNWAALTDRRGGTVPLVFLLGPKYPESRSAILREAFPDSTGVLRQHL